MRNSTLNVGFNIVGMSGPGTGAWSRYVEIVRSLVDSGLHVVSRGTRQQADHFSRLAFSNATFSVVDLSRTERWFQARQLEAFILENDLDVLHLETPPFLSFKNAVVLASIHDLRHHRGSVVSLRTPGAVYQRFALSHHARRVDGILALSQWAAADIGEKLGISQSRIHIVPPVIEAIPLAAGKTNHLSYVLALGHLEERKNLEVLLRAIKLPEWPVNVELWIAGADHGEGLKLRSIAANSSAKVRFLGPVSEQHKSELLSRALAVAVPSTIEGYGIVAAEAPAHGVPALVSNMSSLPELAFHPQAMLEAHNPCAWASRINELHSDAGLRSDILEAQRAGGKIFSRTDMTNRLLGLYEKLLSQ